MCQHTEKFYLEFGSEVNEGNSLWVALHEPVYGPDEVIRNVSLMEKLVIISNCMIVDKMKASNQITS